MCFHLSKQTVVCALGTSDLGILGVSFSFFCNFCFAVLEILAFFLQFKTVLDLADAPGLASGLSIGRLFRGTLLY